MASCLECGKFINPKLWLCKECNEKAMEVFEKSINKKPKIN